MKFNDFMQDWSVYDEVTATTDKLKLFYTDHFTHTLSQISTFLLLTYVCMTLPEVPIEIR